MKKKKKIILIIIVILLILVGAAGYLYKSTDYLKTSKQLFWKYAVMNSEIVEIFNSDEISEIKSKKANNSYTVNSSLNVKVGSSNYKVTSKTNAQNSNDVSTYVDFTKDSTEIIDFNLVKKSNIVGIKMDELANGYITLENSDLTSLAKRIGIENTDDLPDNINWETLMELLEISDDDLSYILDKYSNEIVSNTSMSNYSKDGTETIKINDIIHTAEKYKITLTENEAKQILSDLFLSLSEDSRTLNLISSKLKLLNLSSEYTDISNISNKLKEISEEINETETTDDEFIEIIVYAENYELLQTDITISEDRTIKIIYDKDNNKLTITQEMLNENSNMFMLSISDVLDNIFSKIEQITIKNETSTEDESISTKVEIICKNDVTISYSSITKITNAVAVDSDYEDSLKIVLNDLDDTQLQNLYAAIVESLKNIYLEKKNILLGESEDETDINEANAEDFEENVNDETEENANNEIEENADSETEEDEDSEAEENIDSNLE